MSNQANTLASQDKRRDLKHYLKIAVGLLIMIGFRFIPAPAPITQAGMSVIGMFFSLIYFYTAVDVVWPNIAVMVVFALSAFDIYPASAQSAGIYEVGWRVFGCDMVVLLIGMIILCNTLSECGLVRRIALWFVSRKVSKKGPWWFTVMFLLGTLALGSVMNCAAMCVAMLSVAHECFERMGFKKGDSYPRMMVVVIVWVTSIGYAITPIGHDMAIMFNGMVSSATGTELSLFNYMLVGIPIGLIISALLVLYMKFVMRPDVSQFKNVDYDEIETMRPGKMEKSEIIVSIFFIVVLLAFILPGILDVFVPGNSLSSLLNTLSPAFFIYAALALMAIIRVDGKPILVVETAFSKLSWNIILLIGGIVTVALAMLEDSTGIPAWLGQVVGPLLGGLPPVAAVIAIACVATIATNILNNVAVGAVFCAVCAPLALQLGIHPGVMNMAICLGAQFGYTTPAAWPAIAFATGDEYNGSSSYVLKHGLALTLISIVTLAIFLNPLANAVYS